MHKDGKFYTFLSSQLTNLKIYVSQEKNSQRIFQVSVVSFILIAGILTINFSGFINNNIFAESNLAFRDNPSIINQQIQKLKTIAEYKSINYARPASSEDIAINSGGPIGNLTENESASGEATIESQLRQIETSGNPGFLPTMWAHLGKINNEFGYRRNPFNGRGYEFHAGMDIDGDRGDVIAVPANGIVTNADWEGGYGNMIEIDHGNGLTTRYGHLSRIGVQLGDTVQRGQLIGLIGSTGRSTGPHLHYELRLNDKPINPRRFLPPEQTEIRTLNAE